jgi:enoyl-CoA hydratase
MPDRTYITKSYENILVFETENPDGLSVIIITLNRPKALNAINMPLMSELVGVLEYIDKDESVGCSIITGSEKAFAAGADIKEMAEANVIEMYYREMFERWDRMRRIKKPIIAAVSGFALGGGCELSMVCDIIIASESAKFGQPEINLAIIPGAGGTQRLVKAIGKSKAMDMILTGKMLSGKEMFDAGLVARVVNNETLLEETLKLAKEISSKPTFAVQLAKDSILKSYELSLESGIEYERKNFYLLFATEDKFEGMKAFIEKRKPVWKQK